MHEAVSHTMEEEERKVVSEFCHLLEKSKQLFNGLRDMPQYGHKQWQAYFGRTFDIYTKLWKFQQQHRNILDRKYGLKRWQIGEIASKIGQLYYHYYLRTSETNYLNEAFSFYAAIRGRAYYGRTGRDESRTPHDRTDLMVKKLRYYARFIVVCLLLKKMKLVRDLVRELSKLIDEYTSTYEPEDQLEWSLVLAEIKAFVESDSLVRVLDSDSNSVVLSHRLNPMITPPVERSPVMTLSLQEVIIVGNLTDQVKFSELTLDMFRMLQTLEREPQEELGQVLDTSPAPGRIPLENGVGSVSRGRDNPHKYLLYKPTLPHLLVFLASGYKELPPNGALLLYISADGSFPTRPNPEDTGYDMGGVLMSPKRDVEPSNNKNSGQFKEHCCLFPGDLFPFTRRPTFLILDSDNSLAFSSLPHYFDMPLVVLMSPQDVPPAFQDHCAHKGSLFTLFLHSPMAGFCFVTNIIDVPLQLWDKCLSHIDRFLTEASRLLTRCRGVDASYINFLGDDFLRLLLCRYIFCDALLRIHRSFKSSQYFPKSHPALPELDIIENPTLQRYIMDLATQLDVRHMLFECGEVD